VAIAAVVLLSGPASSRAATQGECVARSLPSFIAQGERGTASSVADVVEVACFDEAGQTVTVEDPQLYAHCGNHLNWAQAAPYTPTSGPSLNVTLDKFGNAAAVLWSVHCGSGETLLTAKLDVAPFSVAQTSFAVLPPHRTPSGLWALPRAQVEGAEGTFATVIDTGFENGSQLKAEISAANVYHRCRARPHLHWIYQGREKTGGKSVTVKLDNNGLAFAILLAGPSCQVGESLIVAELIQAPYTAFTTSFVGEPPREVL
jgi:hypothetical protein